MATGAVGEKAQLLLLDPVFHLAPLAVDFLIKLLRIARHVRDDEPRVGALPVCSALTITRRRRSQLSAAYENSPNSRCFWPVAANCRTARVDFSRPRVSKTGLLGQARARNRCRAGRTNASAASGRSRCRPGR